MLVGVPAMVAREIWPHVVEYIARSLDEVHEYRFDAEDILGQIERGEAQLWIRKDPFDMVVVTEVYRHPKATELSIGPIAGTLGDQWQDELQQLEEWGRGQGCTHVGTLGRAGWERKLGWRKGAVYCVKEL